MKEILLEEAKKFFNHRASYVSRKNSQEELCFVSGRDARIWCNQEIYFGLINSISKHLNLTNETKLLEVGCAAGFLARGLAPLVGMYIGIDVAKKPLQVAQRLNLKKAKFQQCDGTKMPYGDNEFDSVICYDVLTNFQDMDIPSQMIYEMLRVVKPGGKVLVGSIPDKDQEPAFLNAIEKTQLALMRTYGEIVLPKLTIWYKVKNFFWKKISQQEGGITCYYFKREQFVELAKKINVPVEITEVHPENPYAQYRFNVTYIKTGAL